MVLKIIYLIDLKIAASCDNNEVIKSVKDSLSSVSSQLTTGADQKTSIDDCYVLDKGKGRTTGTSHRTYNLTFYADEQVIISIKLGSKNDFKKLIFRGESPIVTGKPVVLPFPLANT